MKFVFGILAFIITTIILIVLIVSLLRGINSSTTTTVNPIKTSYDLNDQAAVDTYARFTVNGPVVADEKYQSVRITVDKSSRKIEVLKGYKGTVDKTQTYPNNPDAYKAFLKALQAAHFADRVDSDADMQTICVTGNRYQFEMSGSGTKKVDTWTNSCGLRGSTFAGSESAVAQLFRAQIPNYSDFGSSITIN